ncbi:MAG: DNA polymerase IV, partial [Pedobacter sp.]
AGEKSYLLLRNMGISQIGTLQQMEPFTMRRVLGENGVSIWNKANGQDNSPVVPFREQKSMSKETTFQIDTIDMDILRRTLIAMVDELAYDLRTQQKLTGCITLKIRYSNFDTHTQQISINYSNSDRVITEKVMELFKKLYSRRMLIRLIGVKFSKLIHGSYQVDLFNDTQEEINLMQAIDKIRNRFGVDYIKKGVCLLDKDKGGGHDDQFA